jgi:hypothetical protein
MSASPRFHDGPAYFRSDDFITSYPDPPFMERWPEGQALTDSIFSGGMVFN